MFSYQRRNEYLKNRHLEHMELGAYYKVELWGNTHCCEFIKVTNKGFNLLDIETSWCILKTHLYTKRFVGKEIPKDIKHISVMLPDSVQIISKIEDSDEESSLSKENSSN